MAGRFVRARASFTVLGWALMAAPVFAQGATSLERPIGWFVFDAHGAVVPFGRNFQLATARGLDPNTEPRLGIGVGAGAHFYPLRIGVLTVGVGVRVITASTTGTPDQEGPNPDGPRLRKRYTSFAPELSLNFGGRDGWSYVSGGMGRSRLSLYDAGSDEPPQRSSHTVNVGGGARWFNRRHLALALDLRFYTARPLEPTLSEPGSPRMTVMVLSVGASFK